MYFQLAVQRSTKNYNRLLFGIKNCRCCVRAPLCFDFFRFLWLVFLEKSSFSITPCPCRTNVKDYKTWAFININFFGVCDPVSQRFKTTVSTEQIMQIEISYGWKQLWIVIEQMATSWLASVSIQCCNLSLL